MSENVLKLFDQLHSKDDKKIKTMIMAGYDLYKDNNGVSWLGEEVIKRQKNKVVTGGAINLLETFFGANTSMNVSTLNNLMGIGEDGIANPGELNTVCLFNIGLGGCGASYADEKVVLDQENIVSQMLPFRVVDSLDDIADSAKYWFCKTQPNGKKAYYLKKFEDTPVIHSLFKDAPSSDQDGTEVSGNPADYDRTDGIETFVEIILRVSSTDIREHFELYDDPDHPRFNSIGLCTGKKGTLPTGEEEYVDVTQFSILNFSNEMLHFDKDLTIIYRVYIS